MTHPRKSLTNMSLKQQILSKRERLARAVETAESCGDPRTEAEARSTVTTLTAELVALEEAASFNAALMHFSATNLTKLADSSHKSAHRTLAIRHLEDFIHRLHLDTFGTL